MGAAEGSAKVTTLPPQVPLDPSLVLPYLRTGERTFYLALLELSLFCGEKQPHRAFMHLQ